MGGTDHYRSESFDPSYTGLGGSWDEQGVSQSAETDLTQLEQHPW